MGFWTMDIVRMEVIKTINKEFIKKDDIIRQVLVLNKQNTTDSLKTLCL